MNQSEILEQLAQLVETRAAQAADVGDEERAKGPTCRELAKAIGLSRQHLTKLLFDLAEEGLVSASRTKRRSPITNRLYSTWAYDLSAKAREMLSAK